MVLKAWRKVATWLLLGGALLLPYESASQSVTIRLNEPDPAPANREAPLLVGIQVHYGLNAPLGYDDTALGVRQIAQIGAESFRASLPWDSFRYGGNMLRLAGSARLFRFLEHNSLKPLIILGLTNRNVPGGIPPISPDGLVKFRQYVDAAVDILEPYKPIYEIWNEWNIGIGTGEPMRRLIGAGDASDPRAAVHYERVAKAAIEEIRHKAPGAKILAGAVGDDIGWKWTRALARDGLLDLADGLSIHLYNHCAAQRARSATEMIGRLQALQDELTDIRGGRQTAIYVTEYGWTGIKDYKCGVDDERQAVNTGQFLLQSAALPWLKGVWLYELKDSGDDPEDPEHHFGLFTHDDAPKPAACFFREATQLVRNATSVSVDEPMPDVFVAQIRSDEGVKMALWTTNPGMQARYSLSAGDIRGRVMCADQVSLAMPESTVIAAPTIFDLPSGKSLKLKLQHPRYVVQ